MDQKGEKNLCGVEIGSSVGEVNPPSKSADGAGSWRDSGPKRRGLMATDSRMRNPSVEKSGLEPDETLHQTSILGNPD